MNDADATRQPVRIVLAEDNDDLRAVMPPLLNEVPPLRCAATTARLDEIAPLIAQHQAQIAVLDIQLRGGSVLPRLPALRAQFPATRFIIHSGHANPELIRHAGADAYVLKSGDFDELVRAIQSLIG
ncbi:MAG TPA: response regulator [Steroidobacteraceae bacterium]|nr:response regulator [Steroidobacteraceae bacterium]